MVFFPGHGQQPLRMGLFSSTFRNGSVAQGERAVACYHCGRESLVPASAQSAACKSCGKHLNLNDVVVTTGGFGLSLATCGTLIVDRNARLVTRNVIASEALEVRGTLNAKVACAGRLVLGHHATVKGDCKAKTLTVEPGAIIEGGYFEIGG
jgi:hypothetical protein